MEKNWQEVLDKNRYVYLLDIYGSLLTERSRETLSLYFNEDWSVSEIAVYFSISRQAVYDSLQRGLEHLDRFEAQLAVYGSREAVQQDLHELKGLILADKKTEALHLVAELEHKI